MTKHEAKILLKQAHLLLQSQGFKRVANQRYDYIKLTRGGLVDLTVKSEYSQHYRGYSLNIYSVFSQPQAAKIVGIDCNPFSGKYNHLFITDLEYLTLILKEYE